MTADLIEGYLDQLLGHLRGSAHDVRRILAETEDHLRDATAELVAACASEEEAQRRSIERFGDPRAVARRFSARLAPVPPGAVAAELAGTAVLLGGVGLVAIGVSGLVAELLGRLLGAGFVAGDLPGMNCTPQRCAEFLEYFPDAGGCDQAAALHHWGEVVEYRVAAGVRPACTAWPRPSSPSRAWTRSWSRAATGPASGSPAPPSPWRWRSHMASRCTAPCSTEPGSAQPPPSSAWQSAPPASHLAAVRRLQPNWTSRVCLVD